MSHKHTAEFINKLSRMIQRREEYKKDPHAVNDEGRNSARDAGCPSSRQRRRDLGSILVTMHLLAASCSLPERTNSQAHAVIDAGHAARAVTAQRRLRARPTS